MLLRPPAKTFRPDQGEETNRRQKQLLWSPPARWVDVAGRVSCSRARREGKKNVAGLWEFQAAKLNGRGSGNRR